jgi:hypothetical protein
MAMSDGFQNFDNKSIQSPTTNFGGTTNYTQVSKPFQIEISYNFDNLK